MMLADPALDLLDAIQGPEPDYDTEPEEPLDHDAANRMLGRLARVNRQAQADADIAETQIAQVRAWLEDRQETTERARKWLTESLERFHLAALKRDPRAKSIDLPNGTLRARQLQPEWHFDTETFLPWAFLHLPSEAVRLRDPEVAKDAAKQLLTRRDEKGRVVAYGANQDGEIAPGVEVIERGLGFSQETR